MAEPTTEPTTATAPPTEGAPPAAAAAPPSPPDYTELLAGYSEWARALVMDENAVVLGHKFTGPLPSAAELGVLLRHFDDREQAIARGMTICGQHYEVHRFYPNLSYGRRGDNTDGEGIALHRAVSVATQRPVYVLITYTLPTVSARAVPQLIDFVKNYVEAS
eukprot:gnl/Hemi2/9065_TR3137_c0_g1_i1.p1 gnl/Hemi2/9065_TR3137_c0_g1~~gnl/Hemi2/9065_TR3137_c0_g1_i1.p1  ORF type:complete len:163 (-),score=13.85 gnl/Hemi2/9065_TR3137_c0_g1_i1:209-697(-)